jgi:hypothetical protein
MVKLIAEQVRKLYVRDLILFSFFFLGEMAQKIEENVLGSYHF